jgi:hypothetical protein
MVPVLCKRTVSQGGFAVVNMSDNAKITDVLHVRFTLFFEVAKVTKRGEREGIYD